MINYAAMKTGRGSTVSNDSRTFEIERPIGREKRLHSQQLCIDDEPQSGHKVTTHTIQCLSSYQYIHTRSGFRLENKLNILLVSGNRSPTRDTKRLDDKCSSYGHLFVDFVCYMSELLLIQVYNNHLNSTVKFNKCLKPTQFRKSLIIHQLLYIRNIIVFIQHSPISNKSKMFRVLSTN